MQVGGTEDGGHGRRGMEDGCPIRGDGDGAEDPRLRLQFPRRSCPSPGPRARMVAMLPEDPLRHSFDIDWPLDVEAVAEKDPTIVNRRPYISGKFFNNSLKKINIQQNIITNK